jgi:hypothetical protein
MKASGVAMAAICEFLWSVVRPCNSISTVAEMKHKHPVI